MADEIALAESISTLRSSGFPKLADAVRLAALERDKAGDVITRLRGEVASARGEALGALDSAAGDLRARVTKAEAIAEAYESQPNMKMWRDHRKNGRALGTCGHCMMCQWLDRLDAVKEI